MIKYPFQKLPRGELWVKKQVKISSLWPSLDTPLDQYIDTSVTSGLSINMNSLLNTSNTWTALAQEFKSIIMDTEHMTSSQQSSGFLHESAWL